MKLSQFKLLAEFLFGKSLPAIVSGYCPKPSKSYLVVHPKFVKKAHQLFDRFGIRIVEGRRYLGGFIGSDEGKIIFTLKKGPRMVGLSWRVVQSGRERTSSCFSWINKITAMRMEFCPERSQRYVAVVCSSREDVGGKLFAKLDRNSSVVSHTQIVFCIHFLSKEGD